MSQFDQHGQQVDRDQYNAGRDLIISPPSPNLFQEIWRFLREHKNAFLGVALLCGIALYPLSPFTVNLVAEYVPFSPFVLLPLALLGISCFEIIPFVFSARYGPWTGFFVGFVGVLLSGLLANMLAGYDFPTKVQVSFNLASGQSSWIWLLVWYSFLIGVSVRLAYRKPETSLSMGSGIILLIAIGIYLVSALMFSQIAVSFTALYPLLAISNQAQVWGGALVLFAILFVPAALLLMALPLSSHPPTPGNSQRRTPRWWLAAAVLIALAIPPGYEISKMQTPSTGLQSQQFPLAIPLACTSCNYPHYPFFQIRLTSIESQNNGSQWDIALTNPGQSPCIVVAFQQATLTDALFHVYQPTPAPRSIHIDSGRSQILPLFYQIIPKSAQHLQFVLSLYLTPCTGTGSAGDTVQGARELLFQ